MPSPPPSAEHVPVPDLQPISPALPGADPLPPDVLPAALPPLAPHTPLARLARALGIDRAVAFTILARAWSSLAGLGTLALIARFLSRAEQGYYYTFYSVVALQIVFELGFSVVILQTASHEAAHLHIAPTGHVSGPATHHTRLAAVLQKAVRWYALAAALMAVVLLPLGLHFFSRQAHNVAQPAAHLSRSAWLGPWILVVCATVGTFLVDPLFSFLEGCGLVREVARTRLSQAITGTLLGWIALSLHHGLFAPGLIILGQALAGSRFVFTRRRLLLPLLRMPTPPTALDWRTEVWPFQWRIAVSWLCGYATFQLFNPILFAFRGPVEAGQMGMSLSICGTLTSMSIAWLNTKAAPFGRMIAHRDFPLLDRTFFRSLAQSTTAAILASTAVALVTLYLRARGVTIALRLLPPLPLALLLFSTVINIVVFGYALYLRAHKQEKFMVNSVVGALWMAPAALLLGHSHGALGIASAYAAGSLVIGLGFGTYTFARWRRIWHA